MINGTINIEDGIEERILMESYYRWDIGVALAARDGASGAGFFQMNLCYVWMTA